MDQPSPIITRHFLAEIAEASLSHARTAFQISIQTGSTPRQKRVIVEQPVSKLSVRTRSHTGDEAAEEETSLHEWDEEDARTLEFP